MSGYEQRAREYLDRFTEEPTWDVYSPDAQAALEAIFESIAAEARAEERERCLTIIEGRTDDGVPSWRAAIRAIRAGDTNPDVRLVAREDLAHALGTCPCEVDDMGCVIEPHRKPHYDAIDRLRAGEE